MTSTSLRSMLFALASGALFACSNPPPVNDGGDASGPADALVFPDASSDASNYRPTYHRCTENADCDTANLEICDRTYAGGMCRRITCGTNTDCGGIGICTRTQGCVPFCTLQSDTCQPYGGICLAFALPFETNTGCFPACNPSAMSNDPEGGMRACTNMLTCDPYQGKCVARVSTSGADNGEPCTDDGQCRSNLCIPEVDVRFGDRPTGFLNGYCTSYAPLPSDATFAAARGMNLPTSTCPPGSVVLPSPDAAPGSATRCLKACTADAQCRSGYRCDRRGGGADMFANGACVPIDCAAAGAMCPDNTSCRMADSDGGTLFTGSRCVRDRDGGASDASAADGASADSAMEAGADAGSMDASAG
ncbi:MAG: hypothetical protein U0269_36800 [Polyangiales bacterium]